MNFISNEIVIKISVSDMKKSEIFFTHILDFQVVLAYTINKGGDFENESYIQLSPDKNKNPSFSLGLYKDIPSPFEPKPNTGTVPSFIVKDIEITLHYLQAQNVVIDSFDGEIILSNTSDMGLKDRFFFFRDPDNNSFVVRQNMNNHFDL